MQNYSALRTLIKCIISAAGFSFTNLNRVRAMQYSLLIFFYAGNSSSITHDIESFSAGDVDAAHSACASYIASLGYTGVAACALPYNDARLADYVYVTNLCADGYPGPDAYNCGHDDTNYVLKSAYFYFPHYSMMDTYEEESYQCSNVGNPINPVTGSKRQTEALIAIDGVQPLSLDLIYNSASLVRWKHSYQRYLTFSSLPTGSRYDTIGSAHGFYSTAVPETPSAFGGGISAHGKKSAVMLDTNPYRYLGKQQACEDGWSSFSRNYQFPWKNNAVASYQATAVSSFATREQCYIYDAPGGDLKMMVDLFDLFSGTPAAPVFSEGMAVDDLYLRFHREDGNVIVFTHYDAIENQSDTGETLEVVESNGENIYRLKTTSDEVEEYTSDGRLRSITSAQGYVQTLSYITDPLPGQGELYQVSNQTGESLTFSYENDGVDGRSSRITSITDHVGRQWSFNYDPAEVTLTSVDMPDGTQRQYHYENAADNQLLTGITDETGLRYASWEYNDKGQAILSAHGPNRDIERVEISYFNDGIRSIKSVRTSALNDPVNIISGYFTSAVSGSPAVARVTNHDPITYEFNADTGNLEYIENKGQRTEYGNYDNRGNPGTITEATGTAEQRSITYTYDPRYHSSIASITEDSVHPGDQKVTSYEHDDFGNNTAIIINGFKPDGTAITRITTFIYNGPYHQLTMIDGPRSDVDDSYTLEYYPDTVEQGSNRARLRNVTDPLGNAVYRDISYTPFGKIESYLDANNLQSSFSYYHGNDRLKSRELYDQDTGDRQLTQWTYLATGEVETVTTGYDVDDKTTLTFNYDEGRRLTSIVDGLGNAIEYVLDSEGNVEQENIRDDTGMLAKQLNRTFDNYNRLQLRSQVNEQLTETWSPEGTLDKVITGNNAVTAYSYDNLRRLIQVVDDEGGSSPQTANATTDFDYDVQDNITTVISPLNGETAYTYDDLGNKLTQNSDDTGLTVYVYDDAENVTGKADANGQVTTYSYDALNRLTSVITGDQENDYYYEYDNCTNGVGRLCKLSNNNHARYYQYDAFGNITSQQAIRYHYDTADRLQSISYPSGAIVEYAFDLAGQIQQVTINRNGIITPLAVNISYQPFGEIKHLLYGNGLILNQSMDSAYRLSSQLIQDVFEFVYTDYDENGNLQQRLDGISGISSQFSYDAHNRLNAASGGFGARTYIYDNNANRTSVTVNGTDTASSYEPLSNRLSMFGLETVTLDNTGNTLSIGNRAYSYNQHNRLFQVFDNGEITATYAYNGLGQRVSKTLADGSGKYFIYDTDGKLMVEADGDGNILYEYIYLEGRLLTVYAPDSDADGISNYEEHRQGTDPVLPDRDHDGIADIDEMFVHGTLPDNADSDGDGINDGDELAFHSSPLDSSINYGDINLDGEFNTGDYVLLMQFVLGTRTPTSTEELQADVNQDGLLNMQDILLMQRVLLDMQLGWLEQPFENLKNIFTRLYSDIIPAAYANTGDGELYYVHNDHLGTPHKLTNESAIVVWQATYDPFGKATITNDVDGDGRPVELNIRFPGQYYDSESGLHYNYYRYYDPEMGRYISSDPIGLSGGMNTYGYVGGNPILFTDFYGLMSSLAAIEALEKIGKNSNEKQNAYNEWIRNPTSENLQKWMDIEAVTPKVAANAIKESTNSLYGYGVGRAAAGILPEKAKKLLDPNFPGEKLRTDGSCLPP